MQDITRKVSYAAMMTKHVIIVASIASKYAYLTAYDRTTCKVRILDKRVLKIRLSSRFNPIGISLFNSLHFGFIGC